MADMVYAAATAATPSTITIDLYDVWRHYWLREWDDLGCLIAMRERREHIDKHEPFQFDSRKSGGWCECFNCRVVDAWEHRNDVRPKQNRRQPR